MPVMKAQQAVRSMQSAIVMDLGDVERDAQRMVAQATQEADQILAKAKAKAVAEALQIREQAKTAGHAEGFQTGHAEGKKQGHDEALAQARQALEELTARWQKTLDEFHQNMAPHHADAKADLVRLALAIAERVTHQEGLRNRDVARATVAEALRMIGAARKVALHVNPEEVSVVETYLPELLAKLRTLESVEVCPDAAVTAGGCLVRYGGGEVDARLEEQIQRISDELLAAE